MQWNWLVSTKLFLAGLALVVVLGDSEAGPFRNRRNNQGNGQMMVDQGATTQVAQPVAGQPVAGQPVAGQPVAGQPGAEAMPMPAATPGTPSVQATQPTYQPVANQRRGLFGRRASRGNNGSFYAPDSIVSAQPAGTTRQSFYQGNSQGAIIDVRVPVANAQIFFDGAATQQQGITRLFATPALNPQAANTYEIKARWTGQDGNPVEQTRTVKVPPGARVLVDFTAQQP